MPAKKIISILALSAVMLLPAGIATAGSVRVNSNDSRVKIYRDGGIRIKSRNGRVIRIRPSRSYRRRLRRRNRAYRSYRSYPVRRKRWSSRCNSKTYQRTVTNRSGSNRSYSYSRTTSCQ